MSELKNRETSYTRRTFLKGVGGAVSVACVTELPSLALSAHQTIDPLVLDSKAGRFVGIRNSATQTDYDFDSWRFEVKLGDRALKSEAAREVSVETQPQHTRLTFDYPDFEVVLVAQQVSTPGFAEYLLQVSHKGGQPFYVERVTVGEFQFRKPFEQMLVHKDGSILRTPINAFLRSREGGAILGLTYPYQAITVSETRNAIGLSYEVETRVPSAQQFETERLFVGTYAFSGLGIFKPLDQVAYRFITSDPEERDLGEIWKMQEYVRSKLPRHEIRQKDQFNMFLNSWWAGLPISKLRPAVDLMADIGVPTVCTRESYFGIVDHISATPQLENLPDGYRIPLPETTKDIIAYAQTKGEKIATFVAPCRSFRPEWEWRSKDGKPSMYGEVRTICFGCREAAEFALNLWDQMIKDSGSDSFSFDGRFLTSFNETDLGSEPIEPLPCYATNHGHKPGHNFYQDYRNGQYIVSELRRRNPGIFLEIYWGFKRAYPWALASLNGCENYYESDGHQDDRMQSWYNQNYRFLPNYLNFAQVRGYNDWEIKKEILSCISISSHLQIGVGVKILDRPENQEFFKKWTAWARENERFLNVKRDLFGQPWSIPLDGSAHFVGDRGYLFLFNESGSDQLGSIPLDQEIGLASGSDYAVKQIYPEEKLLTVAKRGERIFVPVAASGSSVVSVSPGSSGSTALPTIVWANLGSASLRLEGKVLTISNLEGYQGHRHEIVVSTNGTLPERLIVNNVETPFQVRSNTVLAKLDFDPAPTLGALVLREVWDEGTGQIDNKGNLRLKGSAPLRFRQPLGSGIYEMDIECDFTRGGLFLRADPDFQRGIVATALLDWFPPIDGNIGLWDGRFDQFPITWTLGEKLKRGGGYCFRVESYGDRHSFRILDPKTGKTLAGPVAYRVQTVRDVGNFGVRLQEGSAVITRFAFAPAELTQRIRPLAVDLNDLISEAFVAREVTRRMGQIAPPGSRVPVGASTALDFDYVRKEQKLWQESAEKP
jgi:hypothetical protein